MPQIHEAWTLSEDHVPVDEMQVHETLMTLGNGYLGSRGVFEEGLEGSYPGTYLGGVYDARQTQSSEIVNLPNPLLLQLRLEGRLLSPEQFKVEEHQRRLDYRRGVLHRETSYSGEGIGRVAYRSRRFFSLADLHVGAQSAWFQLAERDAAAVVRAAIDCSTMNEVRASGRSIKHYEVVEVELLEGGELYLSVKTHASDIHVGFAVALRVTCDGQAVSGGTFRDQALKDFPALEVAFQAVAGREYRVDRWICVFTSRDTKDVREACERKLRTLREQSMATALQVHEARWDCVWESAVLEIEGDREIQEALRFNQYHLLIAAPLTQDLDTSIPAKTLSGEWYKGHVFWDTEIYALPFFIYTQPAAARNMLMYRYRRLDAARENAVKLGYAGALWPWESAASGLDETPDWWVNFDGSRIPVYNKEREHHIAGDVIYALANYHRLTHDEEFMRQYGAEMVFETARFWASRVTLDQSEGSYEIREVIGPNEFQEAVDNNAYTNFLARWTLEYAADLYQRAGEDGGEAWTELMEKINLGGAEVETWREVASKIAFKIGEGGLIEEFDGYLQLEDVVIHEWDENGMPLWPEEVELAEVKETQLIKQADVVLLLTLFPEAFSDQEKRINLDYYEPRTTHKSSLSPPSYAILAAQLGEIERAYRYCPPSVFVDLKDVHHNTQKGMHAAAIGGAWQMLAHGFGGVWVGKEGLRLSPRLPDHWGRITLRLWYRGALLLCSLSTQRVEVTMMEDNRQDRDGIDIVIFGEEHFLPNGGTIVAESGGEN